MKYISKTFVFLLLIIILTSCNQEKLSYINKESFHDDITIEVGNVVFLEHITLKNNTNKVIYFTMKADVTKEKKHGLTKEKYAYAYENNSDKYKAFKILPKQKASYVVKFTAEHGDNDTKTDRKPPDNIIFEINNEKR